MPLSFPPQPTLPITPRPPPRVTGLSPAVVNAADLEMEERGGGIPEGARRLHSASSPGGRRARREGRPLREGERRVEGGVRHVEDARGRARVTRGARRSAMVPSPVMSMNRRLPMDGYLSLAHSLYFVPVLVEIDVRECTEKRIPLSRRVFGTPVYHNFAQMRSSKCLETGANKFYCRYVCLIFSTIRLPDASEKHATKSRVCTKYFGSKCDEDLLSVSL